MKKLAMLAVIALAVTAPAWASLATPHVAGSMQGWNAGGDPMTEVVAGVWQKTFTGIGAGARHEFKITDGTWSNSFPGPNSWLFADANGDITITYDTNVYADGWSPTVDRLGLSVDPGSWTAVGDFQGWNNANPATLLAPQGGGVHALSMNLAPGTYEGKFVVTGSWDSISWDNRSTNTANWQFTTDAANQTVNFVVDAINGRARIDVVPEPASALLLIGGLLLVRRRR